MPLMTPFSRGGSIQIRLTIAAKARMRRSTQTTPRGRELRSKSPPISAPASCSISAVKRHSSDRRFPASGMKIPPNRLADFLRRPPPEIRGALLYGPDAGLVRERADQLTAAICGDLRDPFRISELTAAIVAADPARLADEVAAMSLVGGRRVVRIRDAGEALTALLAEAFAGSRGDSLIVIEAGDLPARSSLRKLCEATANAGAIACHADSARA